MTEINKLSSESLSNKTSLQSSNQSKVQNGTNVSQPLDLKQNKVQSTSIFQSSTSSQSKLPDQNNADSIFSSLANNPAEKTENQQQDPFADLFSRLEQMLKELTKNNGTANQQNQNTLDSQPISQNTSPTKTGTAGTKTAKTAKAPSDTGDSTGKLQQAKGKAKQFFLDKGLTSHAQKVSDPDLNIHASNLKQGVAGLATGKNDIAIDNDELKSKSVDDIAALIIHEVNHSVTNQPDSKAQEKQSYNLQNQYLGEHGLNKINVDKALNSPIYANLA